MKKYIFVLLAIPIFSLAQNGQGKVGGVITYYFNEYQGDKPDIGAEVRVIKKQDAQNFDLNLFDTFYHANLYRNLSAGYRKNEVPEHIKKQIKDYHGDDESYFAATDRRNSSQCLDLQVSPRAVKATVDATGSFSMLVDPGDYIFCVISNSRKGANMTEVMGKIYCKIFSVGSGQSVDLSHKFDIY